MILETEESVTSLAADGEIIGIQFGLASHDDIRTSSISDCPISHASQLANPFLGLPLETGKCESCGTAEPGKCEGHFGYIELPIPVYHPSHITELKRLLNMICLKCLKMKTNKVPMKNNNGIMERLLSACCEEACHVSVRETKNNDGASFLELKIPGKSRMQEGAWNFLERFGYRYGDGSSRVLLASEVLAMLKKLREETKRKLEKKGFFPQDGYILRYLPVPPNCLSVPDVSDGVSVMSSDLCSSMLKKVLRQIEIIRSSRSGDPNFEAHEVEANDLHIAVSQYLQIRGTSRAARDGDKRFGVSKEGNSSSTKAWLAKMRTLFISKGSGFSSRSVITGDVYRPVNEVGIPSEVAQKMTFEDRVNVHNIQYLQRLVDNNLCLTFRDGLATYSLREGSKGHTFLRIGQVVHRRIMDGDIVFINRPPTTHKHSLQALRVYIHDDHVVKINPLMCGPLAADFDGDCVHLFYPQSLSARAEVTELFSVDKQLLSSHSGNLNLQLATDALLSLKTIFKVYFLNKASAQQLAMHASTPLPSPAVRKASSGPQWTAQQVLQTALPPQFECHGERMMIRGSEVVKLDFNRDVISTVMSDILTSLFFSKSPKDALSFLDALQPLLMENLFAEGSSVSLLDFFVPFTELEDILSQIQDTISPLLFQLRSSFNELVQLQFESTMKDLKLPLKSFILKSSALGGLIESKSESAVEKIVQQIGFLGLQLSDKRKFYSKGLVEEVASLFKMKHPYATLYPSAEFGLVGSCFFRGLDPYEGMVHSIATREVIVRSSKGLAEPGTLFKNLMAVLRDVVICYDGSVRNVSSNSVIQFEYGLEGVSSQSLFPPGEPVGVLAATAMSNPAYKAVLDSSPTSNSSWDMMKEILFCRANFKNDLNDRRVILYLNDCACGRKYCQENASFVVKNHLNKVSLRDAAVEFSIEYKRPKAEPGSADVEAGLVGHIHLNADLLRESRISMADVLQKCEEQVSFLRRKKKYAHFFKRMALSVSDCCLFQKPGKWSDTPCLKFFWDDLDQPNLQKIMHVMVDLICPILLDTVIKGDPRISTVKIVWINPGTTGWVQSPSTDAKGELGVEVTLEKTAVRESGDAWRIVLDCCLPIFHLIDTKRSIPYAIKQVQDLLGISCGFDQAVQRLSTSVTSVTKGVLKEHLILLASSMTCSGTLVGFNISGIKTLYRALSVQAPFTEATLYTPRKCFERASEKCHVDSLAGIVASCSWGKRVAVGTGTNFDVLWDTKEVEKDDKPIDVFNFLHLVRSSNEEEMDSGCLGEDIEKFDWEDSHIDPPLSPDQENKALFDDIIEIEQADDSSKSGGWGALTQKEDDTSGSGGWGAPKKHDSGSGGWGAKKDPVLPEDDTSGSGGWGAPKKPDSGSGAWGAKKDSVLSEDTSGSGGWGAPKKPDSGSGAWGAKKEAVLPEDTSGSGGWGAPKKSDSGSGAWGAKKDAVLPEDTSGSGGWGAPKKQDSGSGAWGAKKDAVRPEDTSGSGGWGAPKKQDSGSGAWGAKKDAVRPEDTSGSGGWGAPKKQDSGSGAWGAKKDAVLAEDTSGSGGWGAPKKQDSGSGGWGAKKDPVLPEDKSGSGSWGGPKKLDSGLAAGNGSANWGSKKDQTQPDNSSKSVGWGAPKAQDSDKEKGAWGNASSSHQEKAAWGAPGTASNRNSNGRGGGGWGSEKKDSNTQSSWRQQSGSSLKNNHEAGLLKEENQTQSSWGQQKSSSGGAGGWSSDNNASSERNSQPSWGQSNNSSGKNSTQNAKVWGSDKSSQPEISTGWGSGKATVASSGNDNEEGGSGGWESKKGGAGTQSSWGQRNDSTIQNDIGGSKIWRSSKEQNTTSKNEEQAGPWDGKKSEQPRTLSSWGSGKKDSGSSDKDCTDGWGSNKSVKADSSDKGSEEDSSGGWGSKNENNNTKSSWGQKSETTPWKSSSSADGWGSNKGNQSGPSGGRGYGRGDNGGGPLGGRGYGRGDNGGGPSGGRGSGRGDNGGGRWGSTNSGEWKPRKPRLPRQPGSIDEPTNVALTATRKRVDLFTAEEQDVLSEVETIMQSIRRILHQSGVEDGEPLPSDDQSYVINNVLEYHPDKEAKKGTGVNFITANKHQTHQESRCFYVVSKDGKTEDFSYIKCLESYIKGKYPSVAESFNSKYFKKSQPRPPPESPNAQAAPESPNAQTAPAPESPNAQAAPAPESPNAQN